MLGEGAAGDDEGAEGEAAEEEEEEEVNLHTAASDGNVEVLKQLLDAGAAVDEVDEEGRTALHFAGECMGGQVPGNLVHPHQMVRCCLYQKVAVSGGVVREWQMFRVLPHGCMHKPESSILHGVSKGVYP